MSMAEKTYVRITCGLIDAAGDIPKNIYDQDFEALYGFNLLIGTEDPKDAGKIAAEYTNIIIQGCLKMC